MLLGQKSNRLGPVFQPLVFRTFLEALLTVQPGNGELLSIDLGHALVLTTFLLENEVCHYTIVFMLRECWWRQTLRHLG